MSSFLIVQGSARQRLKIAKNLAEKSLGQPVISLTQHPDLFYFPANSGENSLGIDAIRNLIKRLSKTTTQAKNKVGLIEEAHRMTREAQNALLKTLEEPPPHSVLILTSPKTERLLPTIVSRCEIRRLTPTIDLPQEDSEYQEAIKAWPEVLRKNRGERLAWVEENKIRFTDKDKTKLWLEAWTSLWRDLVLKQNQAPVPTLLRQALQARRWLITTNVNPRLLWENFLLQLPVVE